MNAVEKAQEFSELTEKKDGLFLVEDKLNPELTVWLDCRGEGTPRVYGYKDGENSSEPVYDVRESKAVKTVKAEAQAAGSSKLDSF